MEAFQPVTFTREYNTQGGGHKKKQVLGDTIECGKVHRHSSYYYGYYRLYLPFRVIIVQGLEKRGTHLGA